jgi:type IX secretion system substrate protein
MFVVQYKPATIQTKIANIASVTKNVLNKNVKVYPNPITDKVNIQLNNIGENNSTAIISLYDVKGKLLQTNKTAFSQHYLNTIVDLPKSLSSGNYFIVVDIQAKTYYSDVLIK